ncbi:DMT family transporter [Sporosarcina sp. SAFN-015]|uniref:DMT family transporter n=1 Tax=Sporosarcina sp. SAFN-015 TaxID=3387274 RepID=UPI003F7FAA88
MPTIALLVLSLLWGSTFYFTKLLLPEFHPISIVFFRCLFGAILLMPLLFIGKGYKELSRKKIYLLAGIPLLSAGVPWIIMSSSLRHLDTTVSAVLNATGPIFGVLLTLFVMKGHVEKQEKVSVAVGFTGIFIAFLFGPSSVGDVQFTSALMLLLAVSLYALSAVLTNRFLHGYSVVTLSFVTMVMGTLFAAPLMLFMEPASYRGLGEFRNVFLFFMLGAINSGVGNLLYYYIVKSRGAIFALSITYLMPITTILLGFFLLHEPVGIGTLIALLLVLYSVFLSKRKDVEQ